MFERYLYSVFLIAALLFSNLGLAINIHYCGSEIEKIDLGYASTELCSLDTNEKSCCKQNGKTRVDETKRDCCKDEIIKQKTDDVVVKVFKLHYLADFVTPVLSRFQPFVVTEVSLPKKVNVSLYCATNAPPLYKLYNQYLFYA